MRRAEAEIEKLNRQQETRKDRLTATRDDGEPLLNGEAAAIVSDEYNEVAKTLLPDAEARQRRHARRAAELQQPRKRESDVERLLQLVASLRDPCSTELRHVWREVIVELDITVETRHVLRGMQRRDIRWSGCLEFTTGAEAVRVPFSGSYADGAGAELEERLKTVTTSIREGTPYNLIPLPSKSILQRSAGERLAAELGIEQVDARALLSITDARCLTGWLSVLDPQHRDRAAEPAEEWLAERARRAIKNAPIRGNTRAWIQPFRHDAHHMYIWVAGSDDGAVTTADCPEEIGNIQHTRSWIRSGFVSHEWDLATYGKLRLHPCEGCGGHRRGLLRLLEPDGSVCLDCRTDRSGHLWPADPYDRYVAEVQDYVSAGLIETMPEEAPDVRFTTRTPLKRPEEFTTEERDAVLAAYAADEMTLAEICEKHGLREAELYRLIKHEGVELRTERKRAALERWEEENG